MRKTPIHRREEAGQVTPEDTTMRRVVGHVLILTVVILLTALAIWFDWGPVVQSVA